MKLVRIRYRSEDDGWWAESPEITGWTAVGKDLEETRELARSGVLEYMGAEALIEEELPKSGESTSVTVAEQPLTNLTIRLTGGSLTTGTSIHSFIAASAVPQSPSYPRGMGPGQLNPDEELESYLVPNTR